MILFWRNIYFAAPLVLAAVGLTVALITLVVKIVELVADSFSVLTSPDADDGAE